MEESRHQSVLRKFCILGVVQRGMVLLRKLNAKYYIHTSLYVKI